MPDHVTNCDSCERVEDLEIELAKWRDDRHYPGELRKCFERVRDAVGSAENDCTAAADIAVARIDLTVALVVGEAVADDGTGRIAFLPTDEEGGRGVGNGLV